MLRGCFLRFLRNHEVWLSNTNMRTRLICLHTNVTKLPAFVNPTHSLNFPFLKNLKINTCYFAQVLDNLLTKQSDSPQFSSHIMSKNSLFLAEKVVISVI